MIKQEVFQTLHGATVEEAVNTVLTSGELISKRQLKQWHFYYILQLVCSVASI